MTNLQKLKEEFENKFYSFVKEGKGKEMIKFIEKAYEQGLEDAKPNPITHSRGNEMDLI